MIKLVLKGIAIIAAVYLISILVANILSPLISGWENGDIVLVLLVVAVLIQLLKSFAPLS